MTIRDIFIKADPRVVNEFFCGVPISGLRNERVFSVCKGLQYVGKHGITANDVKATTDKNRSLSEKQARVVTNHFNAQLSMIYDALGIDSEDEKAEKKLNDYLSRDIEMKDGYDANSMAIHLIWEMKGLKSYYHQYIDRIRTTTDHSTLRRWLQEVESAIKAIVGDDPMLFYMSYMTKAEIDKIHDYLGTRRLLLDQMFTYSDEEVKRFEKVNDLLVGLSKQMYHRTADLYRTILSCGIDRDFDDDYEVEGILNTGVDYDPENGDYNTVLHLDTDDYYGSDFAYMLYVLKENDEKSLFDLDNIEECGIYHSEDNTPDMTDKELDCDWEFLNDGKSWIEWHRHPKLNHICVCHALHSMFDHHQYSLADIIRVNNFCVDAKLDCQHITNQKGRRYNGH